MGVLCDEASSLRHTPRVDIHILRLQEDPIGALERIIIHIRTRTLYTVGGQQESCTALTPALTLSSEGKSVLLPQYYCLSTTASVLPTASRRCGICKHARQVSTATLQADHYSTAGAVSWHVQEHLCAVQCAELGKNLTPKDASRMHMIIHQQQ